MTLNDRCAQLLPPDDHLHVAPLLIEEQRLTVGGAMTAPKAACPDCGQSATRIHSSYQRTLADLPWATTAIRLLLYVRRCLCPTPTCARKTFTERLPGVAPLYARTTTRLAAMQAATGLALAGSAGARQLARQGLPGSRNTVLRRVRQLPIPASPSPHGVGIDD
jgi:transposase